MRGGGDPMHCAHYDMAAVRNHTTESERVHIPVRVQRAFEAPAGVLPQLSDS
ncbi:conserved hypothetical protein [Vreelandella titanicae]|nr:conserved hypothetical protein [Halomonas titanicae]